jgi:hypothetical protein
LPKQEWGTRALKRPPPEGTDAPGSAAIGECKSEITQDETPGKHSKKARGPCTLTGQNLGHKGDDKKGNTQYQEQTRKDDVSQVIHEQVDAIEQYIHNGCKIMQWNANGIRARIKKRRIYKVPHRREPRCLHDIGIPL